MRKLILYLMLFLFATINYAQTGQKDSLNIPSNYARVIVKITAQTSPVEKTGQSIVDKEIILSLSMLRPLKKMDYKFINKRLNLDLEILFMSMESYYNWRESENTNKLLELIDKRFKGYNIEITLIKQAQPD